MKLPRLLWLMLAIGLLSVAARADQNPEIVDLGHGTYALTHWAQTGFARDTGKLKTLALEDAAAFCAKQHKEMKVVRTDTHRPAVPLTGFAYAKVVFKALDANDPELHANTVEAEAGNSETSTTAAAPAPPRTPTDALYGDLMKLDDLRKRGILTEDEFQAQKKKLLEKSN